MEEKSNPGPKVSLPAQNEGSTPDEKLGVNQRKKKTKVMEPLMYHPV